MDNTRIKTYQLRQGRMRQRKLDALEQLSERYCLKLKDAPVVPRAMFPSAEQLILEIGFGMGHATAAWAAANPQSALIGIEVHTPGVANLLLLMQDARLENIRIVQHDALELCERWLPPDCMDGIHVFFPDPWPKKRHHKRRIVQEATLHLFRRVLKPGGYFYFVTDWENYALETLELLANQNWLEIESKGFCEPKPWRARTKFEDRAIREGRQIYEIFCKRVDKL